MPSSSSSAIIGSNDSAIIGYKLFAAISACVKEDCVGVCGIGDAGVGKGGCASLPVLLLPSPLDNEVDAIAVGGEVPPSVSFELAAFLNDIWG